MNDTDSNLMERKGETFIDYKVALNLFKSNFRPLFIVTLIGIGFNFLVNFLFTEYIFYYLINFIPVNIASGLVRIPADVINFGFFGAVMGLANDIMSSGDGFTQIKNSLYYIRKYWLKFVIISIILNWIVYILRFTDPQIDLELGILIRVVSMCWFITIALVHPAILNRKSIIQAFMDNFTLLRTNFSRIFKTFGLFYVIFLLLSSISGIVFYWYIIPYQPLLIENFIFYRRILSYLYSIFGLPIFAFLSIGIYNSELKFKDNPSEIE